MPTYEYACKSCGEHLEVVQSFKDEALTECPACGGPLRKVFGSIGIAFKGSGFYKTDSRSAAAAGKPASTETKSDSGTGSGAGESGGAAKDTPAPSKSDSSAGSSSSSSSGSSGSSGTAAPPASSPAAS
jgi:putative FmdB family regulatory protein